MRRNLLALYLYLELFAFLSRRGRRARTLTEVPRLSPAAARGLPVLELRPRTGRRMTRLFLGLDSVDREKVVFSSRFHGMSSDQVDESCSFPVDCSVTIPRETWGTSGRPVHITVDLPDRDD